MYELIIIGGGPAGMTAAVYAARKKMKTILITPFFGGQAIKSWEIKNYIGFHLISGQELMSRFKEHVNKFSIDTELTSVVELKKGIAQTFIVKTESNKKFEGKTAIIASGKTQRKLNITGEDEFIGKGVTYCVTCDGPLFAESDVAVIGGGNAALDAALQMSKISPKVHLISLETWTGDEITQEKVKDAANISSSIGFQTTQINGSQFVESINIQEIKTQKETVIPVKGVFIEIGSVPASAFCRGLVTMNDIGEVMIDCKAYTSEPGIFAAGDVTDVPEKQIIIAAGDGAKAALGAYRYLMTHK